MGKINLVISEEQIEITGHGETDYCAAISCLIYFVGIWCDIDTKKDGHTIVRPGKKKEIYKAFTDYIKDLAEQYPQGYTVKNNG